MISLFFYTFSFSRPKIVRSKLDFGKTQTTEGQSNNCQPIEKTKPLEEPSQDEAVNYAKEESIKQREEILDTIFNDTEYVPTESTGFIGAPAKQFQPEITGVFSSPNGDFDITGKLQELDQTQRWDKVGAPSANTERMVANTQIFDELERTNVFGVTGKLQDLDQTQQSANAKKMIANTHIFDELEKSGVTVSDTNNLDVLKERSAFGMARNTEPDQSEAFLPLADTSILPEKSQMKSLNNDSLNSVNDLMFNLGIDKSQTNKNGNVQFTYGIDQFDMSGNNTLLKDSSPTIQTKNAVEKMFDETLEVEKLKYAFNDSSRTEEPLAREGIDFFQSELIFCFFC